MNNIKIACVIVTYNRISYLKKTIKAYENQTVLPDIMIVVNNNSTDGTKEFLADWGMTHDGIDKRIVTLPRNLGGSGGFYEGSRVALETDADWVWLSDDDAYPCEDAIEKTKNILASDIIQPDVSAICSAVIENGVISEMHRRRFSRTLTKFKQHEVSQEEYQNQYFELQLFSYVGAVIRKSVLETVGLCNPGLFIYWDDTEHSYRVSRTGKILCFPEIKLIHDVRAAALSDDEEHPDWRFYYAERNYYLFLKRHFSFAFYWNWTQEYLKTRIHLITGRKVPKYTVELAALLDARNEQLGLHSLYKPGWKY